MRDGYFYDGDSIAVDRIIVAGLGNNFTLKRPQLIKGSRRVFLKSNHPTYLAIEVTGRTNFEIWGIASWVVHRLAGSRAKR